MGTKIVDLPAAAALDGTELVPIHQAPDTVHTTTAAIAGLAPPPPPPPHGCLLTLNMAAVPGGGVIPASLNQVWGSDSFIVSDSPGFVTVPVDGYWLISMHFAYGISSLLGFVELNVSGDGGLPVSAVGQVPSSFTVDIANVATASAVTQRMVGGDFLLFTMARDQSDAVELFSSRIGLVWLGDIPVVPPPPPQPPPVISYLLDHFEDAAGTNITAHPMDRGPGWSIITSAGGSGSIESNMLEVVTTSIGDTILYSDAGHADGVETVSMEIFSDGANAGVAFRVVDLSNFWLGHVDLNVGLFQVWKCVSGVFTLMDSASVTVSTSHFYALSLRQSSDTITFGVDAETPIVIVDADLVGSTLWGLYIGGEIALNDILYDDFAVNP